MSSVSIIIVSWNVKEALARNLERLCSLACHPQLEVIVVDNGSHDGRPTMLRMRFPRVHLVQNDQNRGFAYACNQGLRLATGNILLLLNPDMLVGRGVIEQTVEVLTRRLDVGVMGVKLVKPDGSIVPSVRRDPMLPDQLAILLKLAKLFPGTTRRYLATDFDYTQSQVVQQVRGSYFAFRRDVMDRVGPLDAQRFFIWFEEVDYCRRVREAGFVVWYSADVWCTDLVGQSFRQQRLALKQARFIRSMGNYFLKWHQPWQGMLILTLRPFMVMAAWVVDQMRSRV